MTDNQLMIDIETLSTQTNAVVLSIGAVVFQFGEVSKPEELDYIYHALSISDGTQSKRHLCTNTISWWLEQDRSVLKEALKGEFTAPDALEELSSFCKQHEIKNIWGYGNMFDNAIMRDLYKDAGLEYPVSYRDDMDMRTLVYMAQYLMGMKYNIPHYKHGTLHNALDDAVSQAITAQQIFMDIQDGIKA